MTFEDFKQELPSIISHSKGYQIEYNLPILSGKWKKKDADLAIINRDSAEHQNFVILLYTSKSEQCHIDRTYAK